MNKTERDLYTLLNNIGRLGISLRLTPENRLIASPKSTLEQCPWIIEAIKDHKFGIIRAMREDQRLRETDTIQSERQAFQVVKELLHG